MVKAFIFAGNSQEYRWFIGENKLNTKEYPQLLGLDTLKGAPGADIIRVGSWHRATHEYIDQMEAIQQAMKRV